LRIKLVLDLMRRFELVTVGNACLETRQSEEPEDVYDASWLFFRNRPRYKTIAHGSGDQWRFLPAPVRRAVHKTKRRYPKMPQHGE
jgi:hypothetical protein